MRGKEAGGDAWLDDWVIEDRGIVIGTWGLGDSGTGRLGDLGTWRPGDEER